MIYLQIICWYYKVGHSHDQIDATWGHAAQTIRDRNVMSLSELIEIFQKSCKGKMMNYPFARGAKEITDPITGRKSWNFEECGVPRVTLHVAITNLTPLWKACQIEGGLHYHTFQAGFKIKWEDGVENTPVLYWKNKFSDIEWAGYIIPFKDPSSLAVRDKLAYPLNSVPRPLPDFGGLGTKSGLSTSFLSYIRSLVEHNALSEVRTVLYVLICGLHI